MMAKAIVVGDLSISKTALLVCMFDGYFDSVLLSTVYAEYYLLPVSVGALTWTLSIWDIAGQE
jgi:GTPase SAR1 family protein